MDTVQPIHRKEYFSARLYILLLGEQLCDILTKSNYSAISIASTSTDDPSRAQKRKQCQVTNHENRTSTMCHVCEKACCGPCTKITKVTCKNCA